MPDRGPPHVVAVLDGPIGLIARGQHGGGTLPDHAEVCPDRPEGDDRQQPDDPDGHQGAAPPRHGGDHKRRDDRGQPGAATERHGQWHGQKDDGPGPGSPQPTVGAEADRKRDEPREAHDSGHAHDVVGAEGPHGTDRLVSNSGSRSGEELIGADTALEHPDRHDRTEHDPEVAPSLEAEGDRDGYDDKDLGVPDDPRQARLEVGGTQRGGDVSSQDAGYAEHDRSTERDGAAHEQLSEADKPDQRDRAQVDGVDLDALGLALHTGRNAQECQGDCDDDRRPLPKQLGGSNERGRRGSQGPGREPPRLGPTEGRSRGHQRARTRKAGLFARGGANRASAVEARLEYADGELPRGGRSSRHRPWR